METALSIIARPFFGLVLFFGAFLLARAVMRLVPEGRLRNILLREMRIVARTEAERRDWLPVILIWGFNIIFFGTIWYVMKHSGM